MKRISRSGFFRQPWGNGEVGEKCFQSGMSICTLVMAGYLDEVKLFMSHQPPSSALPPKGPLTHRLK
jgi:hypothetical protein